MIYLPNPTLPLPLWKGLVESDSEYGKSVAKFLKKFKQKKEYAISVTSLPVAPRQRILVSRHRDKIIVDPIKDLWVTFQGTVMHNHLQMVTMMDTELRDRFIPEERKFIRFEFKGLKYFVHGQYDLYDKHHRQLWDYKYVSVRSMDFEKTDYEWQLNILRLIFEDAYKDRPGFIVKRIANCFLFKDAVRSRQNENNPLLNARVVEWELKPKDEVMDFIIQRARAHRLAEKMDDNNLPFCTDEERWRSKHYAFYKLTKKGEVSKRASYRSSSKEEIEKKIADDPTTAGGKLVELGGTPRRCLTCKAAPFCNQRLEELKNGQDEVLEEDLNECPY